MVVLTAVFALFAADVNWARLEQQLSAYKSAVESRDIEKAHKISLELMRATGDEWMAQSPTPAMRLLEAEKRVDGKPGNRILSLPYMASQAFLAGDLTKAEQYARETLQTPSSAYDSIHTGNNVLGLVALRHNDLPAAKAYLIAAAKTKGHPNLKRYGPNLALAKELLDKGEKNTVLEYLELCKSFVVENPKLDVWIATLKGGAALDLSHEFLWYQ